MDPGVQLAVKWYDVKKAVWRAKERNADRLVIMPAMVIVSDNEYETGESCSRIGGMDDFNWAANAMYAVQRHQARINFTASEVDTFLNRIVNPTGGYAPTSYAADLNRRTGTLEYTPLPNGGWRLTYDQPYRVPWAVSCIASTTFRDTEEAIAIFGYDIITDTLEGAFRRTAYLTFQGD